MADLRPGVLLDRDGTVIREKHYLSEPDGVELLPGAGAAVRRLNQAGLPVALVTNQSGVARGYFDEQAVAAVHDRLASLLEEEGARLDGVWYCPHHPEFGPPCDCRKPAPGLAAAAARDLGLDLGRSWIVGDKLCDVDLGRGTGATPLLVRTGHGARDAEDHAAALADVAVVDDLSAAVEAILEGME